MVGLRTDYTSLKRMVVVMLVVVEPKVALHGLLLLPSAQKPTNQPKPHTTTYLYAS
jgi:hypothetical protein